VCLQSPGGGRWELHPIGHNSVSSREACQCR
jgi:hypothetical protein